MLQANEFIDHVYSFIPPFIWFGFSYEVHVRMMTEEGRMLMHDTGCRQTPGSCKLYFEPRRARRIRHEAHEEKAGGKRHQKDGFWKSYAYSIICWLTNNLNTREDSCSPVFLRDLRGSRIPLRLPRLFMHLASCIMHPELLTLTLTPAMNCLKLFLDYPQFAEEEGLRNYLELTQGNLPHVDHDQISWARQVIDT